MKRFAFFCAQSISHLNFLLPLADELVRGGHVVDVFTEPPLRGAVERAGATFHDLYDGCPVEAADARSVPVPCRYVAHAGVFGAEISERVRELEPDVLVYEMFAVVALVVARELGLPAVNVLPNHDPVPDRVLADVRAHREIALSPECEAAVARLRDVHGIAGAHPLMYHDALSETLNLYPQPAEFLPTADRPAFEPVDFLGALTPALREGGSSPFGERRGRRVLAAFGAIVWRYFAEEAGTALVAVAEACERGGDELVVGLGGAPVPAFLRTRLEERGAVVFDHVDQWAALAEADVFVTHNGVNSTHEAIYHRTPMVSHPFFGDQPALAARCGDQGIAIPLAGDDVEGAFAELDDRSAEVAAALDQAREWELRTIADRPRVAARVVALTG